MAPASNTLAMDGWSIIARACFSALKRVMTRLVSIPSLITFSATSRFRTELAGSIDGPHSPFADRLEQFVFADLRPVECRLCLPVVRMRRVVVGGLNRGIDEELVGFVQCLKERDDARSHLRIIAACGFEEAVAILGRNFGGLVQNFAQRRVIRGCVHGMLRSALRNCPIRNSNVSKGSIVPVELPIEHRPRIGPFSLYGSR